MFNAIRTKLPAGGLINNHQFSEELVRAVYETCVAAGIDYMEKVGAVIGGVITLLEDPRPTDEDLAAAEADDDEAALTRFAAAVDVVTFEFENIPLATVEVLQGLVPLRPGALAALVDASRQRERLRPASRGDPASGFLEQPEARRSAPALVKQHDLSSVLGLTQWRRAAPRASPAKLTRGSSRKRILAARPRQN